MITITVDGQVYQTENPVSIMEFCKIQSISIPGLCTTALTGAGSSCMICLVQDVRKNRLIPSCSALIENQMVIETGSPAVLKARTDALNLLLSDHSADCVPPCRRVCPWNIPIEEVMVLLKHKQFQQALLLIRAFYTNGELVCLKCRAYCKSACRRQFYDQPLGIRELFLSLVEIHPPPAHISNPEAVPFKKSGFFYSTAGALTRENVSVLINADNAHDRTSCAPDHHALEAERCLECGCEREYDCRLRTLCQEYKATQHRHQRLEKNLKQIQLHRNLIYEQGKCIRCGICIRVFRNAGIQDGLTFLQRGKALTVGVPFDQLTSCPQETAQLCRELCPTGALKTR